MITLLIASPCEALSLTAVFRNDVAVMRSMRNGVAAGSVDLREANRVSDISASFRAVALVQRQGAKGLAPTERSDRGASAASA